MKLIYIYVEDFPPFKKQAFNFVSDYRCVYRDGRFTIDHRSLTPTHFFSPKDELCVSALVGPNGSGKTSVVRLLESLVFLHHVCKYIVLVEAKGRLVVYYNLDTKLDVEPIGCVISDQNILDENRQLESDRRGDKLGECMSIAYFSPHYSISAPISHVQDGIFADISTTAFLNKAASGVKGTGISAADKFRADEMVREIRFLREARFLEPRPQRILVKPRNWQLREMVEVFAQCVADEDGKRERIREGYAKPRLNLKDSELTRLKFILSFISAPEKDIFLQIVKCIIASLWYATSGYYSSSIRRRPFLKELLVFMRKKRQWSRCGVVHFFKNISRNPEWENLAKSVEILSNLSINGDAIEVATIKDSKRAEELIEAIWKCSNLATFCDFVYDPPLSAGEHSRLVLYSRLFEMFEDRRSSEAGYDGTDISCPYAHNWQSGWLVVLDEAEITLHPEWQRQLVQDMLRTFDASFPGFNVHFIFATHSPILLSDIPRGNVVFLSKGRAVSCNDESAPNTFGANIFDLYRGPFGVTKGQWGQFAYEKINMLFKKVNDNQPFDDDDEKLISLIGDNLVRDFLSKQKRLRSSECRHKIAEADYIQ